MSKSEIERLVQRYFIEDNYIFPGDFEHRVDQKSSAIVYSLIRHFKPTNILEIGTSYGGLTCIIMAALVKNKKPFTFVASELLGDLRSRAENNVLRECGDVPMMIGDITKNLDKVPDGLDFLFIDHDHDEPTTQWIIDNIYPKCKRGAIIGMHDWAVQEMGGKWVGKAHLPPFTDGDTSRKDWPETELMVKLHEEGKLPLEKLYWAYEGVWGEMETGFWRYKPNA